MSDEPCVQAAVRLADLIGHAYPDDASVAIFVFRADSDGTLDVGFASQTPTGNLHRWMLRWLAHEHCAICHGELSKHAVDGKDGAFLCPEAKDGT